MARDASLEALVGQWIRPEVRALSAYHIPESAGLIKLDAMENPYGWPNEMVEEWLERLRAVPLNRYPDGSAVVLRQVLRNAMQVPDEMELLLGNGSDELIQILASAVAGPGRTVIAPEPTFVMYRLISAYAGLGYRGVLLQPDFSLDLPALLAAVHEYRPALVFLAYPNNPTGNLFDEDAMRAVIEASPGLVVVDEAYHVFARKSFLNALPDYPNLLILRTLSKLGLAGLRLGVLIGHPGWLTELDKIRLPYNINVLTQVSAAFALQHDEVVEAQAQIIRAERARVYAAMLGLPGISVYESQANFLLFRTPPGQGPRLFEALKHEGILIKNLHGSHPALQDCLRVTVGKPEENDAFLSALARIG
jgi:histidinol-phosphate aminotransferase